MSSGKQAGKVAGSAFLLAKAGVLPEVDNHRVNGPM